MISTALATALAEEFGTPLYVYDLADVDQRVAELRAVLPDGARLLYSLKANPLPAVAAAARRAGCGAEVSSARELDVALEAGFLPDEVIYTGPAKGDAELNQAAERRIGCYSAESWRDLARIAAAARRAHRTSRVILRVNPASAPRARLPITGVPSPFGFDAADLDDLPARLSTVDGVDVVGVHVYLGTQAADVTALGEMFGAALDTADRLAPSVAMQVIDLGGGFPWPYASSDAAPDLRPLAAPLAALTEPRQGANAVALWFESGRYVAASSGTLIARLMDVKQSRGTIYYVLDTGVSHLGGMPGLGRILRPRVSLVPVGEQVANETIVADIVGPLCTTLDCIGRAVPVPVMQPGALVAIPNVGAYGATASLSAFLSRTPALEVAVRAGRIVDVARLRSGHEMVPLPQGVS